MAGFDDVRLAAFANPPTTIAQPKYEMGMAAMTMLLERMRDLEMPAHRRTFETSLVTRKSTAAVRGT